MASEFGIYANLYLIEFKESYMPGKSSLVIWTLELNIEHNYSILRHYRPSSKTPILLITWTIGSAQ